MSQQDWQAIRADYEQGGTLRSLADKYDVSKTTLIRKRNSEGWTKDRIGGPRTGPPTPLGGPTPLPLPADALSIARIGLSQLAQHLQAEDILPISSHKSLSDALAQYVKVLLTAPQETETREGLLIPLDGISDHTRREIRRLLLEDAEQREVS